eukprot:4627196-Amphidinium_carterae.1
MEVLEHMDAASIANCIKAGNDQACLGPVDRPLCMFAGDAFPIEASAAAGQIQEGWSEGCSSALACGCDHICPFLTAGVVDCSPLSCAACGVSPETMSFACRTNHTTRAICSCKAESGSWRSANTLIGLLALVAIMLTLSNEMKEQASPDSAAHPGKKRGCVLVCVGWVSGCTCSAR